MSWKEIVSNTFQYIFCVLPFVIDYPLVLNEALELNPTKYFRRL